MAVKPMAGTARMVPATTPFRTSCRTSTRESRRAQQLELPLLGLLVPEVAVEDVAGLVEVARPARALVVDGLALGEELQALDGAVHLDAAALRDPPHVILDRGAGGLALRVGDGERD